MIAHDIDDASPSQPTLLSFPELDKDFTQLPAAAADAALTGCLLKIQNLPVDETSPIWLARLGQTVSHLLVAASGHSPEVLDTLIGRLAHWTMDRFAQWDAVAAELLVALAQHSPRSLALASRTLLKRLLPVQTPPPPLPAWTATLIGLLRQATKDPGAAELAQSALAALPDWRTLLTPDAFRQVLACDDRQALLRLVGHISLLSLVDTSQQPSRPLTQALVEGDPAPPIAPDMRAFVQHHVATETVRLHWLLTPQGNHWIEAVLNKAATLFPAPACQQLHQEIVLSLARSAAVEHRALQGAEAVLALGQLLRWVGSTPQAWAPVWVAVRQLSGMAKARPTRATPDTDRSRTVNTLLCPGGLTGRLEEVGWRVALLKQHGLPLTDFLSQLVQQAPCSPNGQPLVARVLQVAIGTPQEHQLALTELCSGQDLPSHAGAVIYTRHMLHRARLLALQTAQEDGTHDQRALNHETLLQQVAGALGPGVLMLALFSHVHLEMNYPDWSKDGALWLMAQLQASVQALPPGVNSDWVQSICHSFDDDMSVALPPAQHQQWSAWLQTL